MHQILFGGRTPPGPAGVLKRSPRPPSRNEGCLLLREGEGREGRGGGAGDGGREGRGGGREGRGAGEGERGDCSMNLRGDRRPCLQQY